MTFKIVHGGWKQEFEEALQTDGSALRIICPFIKTNALENLLPPRETPIQVITRFNLSDFADRVSDVRALRKLLEVGARVRGVRNLHAKLYMFGSSRAMVTSANITETAMRRNHEFGVVASDPAAVDRCLSYFDELWERAGEDLRPEQLDAWAQTVADHRHMGGRLAGRPDLRDFGVDAEFMEHSPVPTPFSIHDAPQAFVKFSGRSNDRVPLSLPVIEELGGSAFHRVACYPTTRRPRSVVDGAVMFTGRFVEGPDIRVFGRGIGSEHIPGRDEATTEDLDLRPWKKEWSNYVRLDRVEFVDGTLADGVSLYDMMGDLGHDSFASTQRNHARGEGNTDPRLAYSQHPAVKLSTEGFEWLTESLERALQRHGRVPENMLATLDWPDA